MDTSSLIHLNHRHHRSCTFAVWEARAAPAPSTSSDSKVIQAGGPHSWPYLPARDPVLDCHKLVTCHCLGHTGPSSSGRNKALIRAGMALTNLCDLQGP